MPGDEHVLVAIESVAVPQSFKCPLTLDIMPDPAVTVDGQVYERTTIQQWFQRGNTTSPYALSVARVLRSSMVQFQQLDDDVPFQQPISPAMAACFRVILPTASMATKKRLAACGEIGRRSRG